MSRRTCIFCGDAPTTREHIIPKWASAILHEGSPLRRIGDDSAHWQEGRALKRAWKSKRPVDFVVNCVCARCNGGWMSLIEESSKEPASEMIRGNRVDLDLRQQETIATWLSLKAVMARHIDKEAALVPQDMRDYFFQYHRPPNTWHVWLSHYDGSLPVYMGATDITAALSHELVPFPRRSVGILATFAIGYLGAAVYGLGELVPVTVDRTLFVEVWPNPLLPGSAGYTSGDFASKSWPPPRSVDDHLLEQMRHRLPQDF